MFTVIEKKKVGKRLRRLPAEAQALYPGYCMKARSNRSNPAAVKELQNPHRDNAVIGLRFYSLFQLTVSPRFFAFFMQYPV